MIMREYPRPRLFRAMGGPDGISIYQSTNETDAVRVAAMIDNDEAAAELALRLECGPYLLEVLQWLYDRGDLPAESLKLIEIAYWNSTASNIQRTV